MEKLNLVNGSYINAYNNEDYIKDYQKIDSDCEAIFSGDESANDDYDTDQAIKYVRNNNSDFMLEPDAQIYILYDEKNVPVSLAITCRYENSDAFIEELLYTKRNERFMGYGELLLNSMARNLKKNYGASELYAFIADSNEPSKNFHETFVNKNALTFFITNSHESVYRYEFQLKNLKEEQVNFVKVNDNKKMEEFNL